MKKLVAVLAAAVLAGGAIFAGDFYNGDIQIQLGAGFDSVKVEDVDDRVKATIVDFGLESWHLFKPIDLLGVGFSVGFNGGIGPTDKMLNGTDNGMSANFNFNIGPAAAIYLGKIVRFGLNFGFATGFNFDQPVIAKTKITVGSRSYESNYTSEVWSKFTGIDFGLQAKFFPESVVNPVVGWRLVTGSNKEYTVNNHYYSTLSGSNSHLEDVNGKYRFTQNVLYAALSFSW